MEDLDVVVPAARAAVNNLIEQYQRDLAVYRLS
jgi:hypothetical protein